MDAINNNHDFGPENQSAVNWFEIPTIDFERAVLFYETIFDTVFHRMEIAAGTLTPTPMAVFPSTGGGATGALVYIPEHKPAAAGPLLYLNANPNLDVVLARVEEAGGKLLMGKTMLPNNFGFMAIFFDSEGNHMALHSSE